MNMDRPERESTLVPDPRDRIIDLEAQIEGLAEAADRCERMMLAAKMSAAAGGAVLVLLLTGLLPANPTAFVMSIAAGLGGIALFGSTKTTLHQTRAALNARQAEMSQLIEGLELRAIAEGSGSSPHVAESQ